MNNIFERFYLIIIKTLISLNIQMENIFDFSYKSDMDWDAPRLSISSVLEMLSEPFDRDGVAEKTFMKHYNNESSEYYHKSKDEIIMMWEAKGALSRKYGTLLDEYIGTILTKTPEELEIWKLDNNVEYDERLNGLCKSFDDFYELIMSSGDVEYVDREKSLYYKDGDHYFNGRFDCMFHNKRTNKYIIIDWKSSGEIEKVQNKFTSMLKGPMCLYPALNWYTYSMQLSFYKFTLLNGGYIKDPDIKIGENDIETLIVNLPGKMIKESGKWFQVHKTAFPYDEDLIKKTLSFAYKKYTLLNAKNK